MERETGIIWNDEEQVATVWTVSPIWLRRLRPILGEPENRGGSYNWTVDKARIRIVRARKAAKRVLTDEQRAALAARWKKPNVEKGAV